MPEINKKASHMERPSSCVIARGLGLPHPYVKQLKALTGCFNCFENLTIDATGKYCANMPLRAAPTGHCTNCSAVQTSAVVFE